MAKNRRVKATSEEEEIMRRAEARASEIEKKTAERQASIPSFNEEAERQRVIESKRQPGLTIVEGAESGMPGQKKREELLEQKTTTYSPGEVINSVALQNILKDEKQDVALNSFLNADLKTKTDILESIEDKNTTLDDIDEIEADSDAAEKLIQEEQTNLVNASSNFLTTVGEDKDKPSYDKYATREDVQNEIDKRMSNYGSSAPIGAIEKLGIQDYYPQVGRDIAVGTFTGSRIGSQTIYSGAGALLPMGLYDARKRALAEAAKQRQKDLDKYLQIPDTAAQFNERFANYAGNIVYDIAERNNYDPSRIGRDREGQIEMKRLEATGKKIIATDKQIDAFLEAANPEKGANAAYIPEKMKDAMYNFKNGLVDNMEDYFSGKKDIGEFAENFRLYKDGTSWIDENFPKWTDESNKTQRSISLKTGVELTDDNIKEINETIKALQADGNPDYDTYATVFKKYFSINDKRVDNWLDLQGYPEDDLARETLKDYLNNLVPAASFVEEIKGNPNQNFGRWAKRMDLSIEKEKNKSFFTRVVDEANRLNVPGRAVNISKNWNSKSQDQKQNELSGIYQGIGLAIKNPKNKKDAYGSIKVDSKTAMERPVTASIEDPNVKIRVKNIATGQEEDITLGYAAKYMGKNGEFLLGGKKYKATGDTYTAISDARTNKNIPIIDNEKQVRAAYYGNDGKLYNASTDNLNAYVGSNKKTYSTTVVGNPGVYVDVLDYVDPTTNQKVYKKQMQRSGAIITYSGDLNDLTDRALFDYTQGVGQQSYVGGDVKQSVEK
jgi:hypothetical protein